MSLSKYIHKKHRLFPTKQDQIYLEGLQQYLSQLKIHQRANVIELIHRWIPTQEFLKKRHFSTCSICPRYNLTPEDASHILHCPDRQASEFRTSELYNMLTKLTHKNTSIHISSCQAPPRTTHDPTGISK